MRKLSMLMAVSAVMALINGVMLIATPDMALSMHGVHNSGDAAIALARILGATLIGFGVLNWVARKSEPSLALWGVVMGDALADSMSFGISLAEQLQGSAVDASGWLTVILYLAFASGFWFFFFTVRLK